MGVPESALDTYQVQVDFAIPEANEPEDRQAWWHITFEAPEGMSKEERLFILFPLLIHPDTGEPMHTVEEMQKLVVSVNHSSHRLLLRNNTKQP